MLSLIYLPINPGIRINTSFSSSSISTSAHDYSSSAIANPRNSSVLKLNLGGRSKCAASADEKIIIINEEGVEGLEVIPKHVAVIMDGNRRWAKKRGLPVQVGHRAGAKALKQLAINCSKFGVKVLSAFAFSTENWIRPTEEVDFLMSLFEEVLKSEMKELIENKIRLSIMGNKGRLSKSLQKLICWSEEETLGKGKDQQGMHLVIALNYSGQYDITQATKRIARKVRDGILDVDDIDERLFEQHLETNGIEFPKPDLLIRTSGELRISNFMLWQLAYTEMLFVDKLFPDFNEADFSQALIAFQQRQRRYGGGGCGGGHKYYY